MKTMKKINILALLVLMIGFMTSCMDDFLERNPYGSIDENTFFTKAEHADLAAMACYGKMQKLNRHWAGAQLELGMTGDLSSAGLKDGQPFYVGSFNPNESNVVKGIWQRAYEIFGRKTVYSCFLAFPFSAVLWRYSFAFCICK
jgi:hypothetical protein